MLALERLQQEYAELSVERRENDKEVESIRKEADETEYRMAERLRTHEVEVNELLNGYWTLRQQLGETSVRICHHVNNPHEIFLQKHTLIRWQPDSELLTRRRSVFEEV